MRGVLVILVLGLSGFFLLFFLSFFFLFATQSWKKRLGFVLSVDTMGLVGFCIMVMVLGVL